jgi:hypothetical protein
MKNTMEDAVLAEIYVLDTSPADKLVLLTIHGRTDAHPQASGGLGAKRHVAYLWSS